MAAIFQRDHRTAFEQTERTGDLTSDVWKNIVDRGQVFYLVAESRDAEIVNSTRDDQAKVREIRIHIKGETMLGHPPADFYPNGGDLPERSSNRLRADRTHRRSHERRLEEYR